MANKILAKFALTSQKLKIIEDFFFRNFLFLLVSNQHIKECVWQYDQGLIQMPNFGFRAGIWPFLAVDNVCVRGPDQQYHSSQLLSLERPRHFECNLWVSIRLEEDSQVQSKRHDFSNNKGLETIREIYWVVYSFLRWIVFLIMMQVLFDPLVVFAWDNNILCSLAERNGKL